jgi:plasmid maintenance system antidote protein VapI
MSADELRGVIGRLGVSHEALAQALRVDSRSVRRWLANKHPIPPLIARLLDLIDAGRITLDDLA